MGKFKHNCKKEYLEELTKYRVYCKSCGHSIIMVDNDRTCCTWCGHFIYRTPAAEFKDKLKTALINNK